MAARRKRKAPRKTKPISRKDLNKKFFGLAREIKKVANTGVTSREINEFVNHLTSKYTSNDPFHKDTPVSKYEDE
jgi:hypothetical protein